MVLMPLSLTKLSPARSILPNRAVALTRRRFRATKLRVETHHDNKEEDPISIQTKDVKSTNYNIAR